MLKSILNKKWRHFGAAGLFAGISLLVPRKKKVILVFPVPRAPSQGAAPLAGFPYGDGTDYLDAIGMISRCKSICRKTKAMLFFYTPWVPPGVRRFVRNFNCFYTCCHNSGAVFYDGNPVKVALKSVLFAIACVRFRLNFFRFRLDAQLFYGGLKLLGRFRVIDLKTMPWSDH